MCKHVFNITYGNYYSLFRAKNKVTPSLMLYVNNIQYDKIKCDNFIVLTNYNSKYSFFFCLS